MLLLADLTGTKGWKVFLDIATVIIATGSVAGLLAGVWEVFAASIRSRPGRYGDVFAYGFIVGGVGGAVVEGLAKLGVS